MDIHDRPLLKHTSAQALSAAGSTPRNLVMLHTGVALGFSLLATVLQYILSLGIGDTGGLAGLGMRSVLSSAQSFLQVAGMILLPFWEMGILRALLLISRRQEADKPTLLDGFRRFGPIFRLQLPQGAARPLRHTASISFCFSQASSAGILTCPAQPGRW